jgi:hypothetical protein
LFKIIINKNKKKKTYQICIPYVKNKKSIKNTLIYFIVFNLFSYFLIHSFFLQTLVIFWRNTTVWKSSSKKNEKLFPDTKVCFGMGKNRQDEEEEEEEGEEEGEEGVLG